MWLGRDELDTGDDDGNPSTVAVRASRKRAPEFVAVAMAGDGVGVGVDPPKAEWLGVLGSVLALA